MTVQYLAISHVWGQAKWQDISRIDFGQILVSESKARFITEDLSRIVGEEYFWMDVLCVDQKDKEARVAMTQYIPRIFRHALRTVFVKDDVIQSCCVRAMEFDSMEKIGEGLSVHREECHPG